MSEYVGLYVDGDIQDSELSLAEGFRVQVERGYDGSGLDYVCEHCGESVDEEGSDEEGSTACTGRCGECGRPLDETFGDGSDPDNDQCDGIHLCADSCDAPAHECDSLGCNGITRTEPVHTVGARKSLSWVNSAALDFDPRDDSVTVTVSVGDPRGAFAMTLRQVTPDEGESYLIMHTPYPGEAWPHMPLEYRGQGSYRILRYGATAIPDPRTLPAPEPVAPTNRRERMRRALARALARLAERIDL